MSKVTPKFKFNLINRQSFSFGQVIPGLSIHGRPAPYPVMNERAVRAAAGLMLIAAAVAFSLALFEKIYLPIRIITVVFLFDFAARVVAGLTPFSPFGVLGTLLVRKQEPEWSGAIQKRFAWTLGLLMALSMSIITNLNIRGTLPMTMCLICMALMWMEAALGICVGCKMYNWLVKAKIFKAPEHAPACAGDACNAVR